MHVAWRPLVAACAACFSAVCVQPLDTMYLQRQLQTRSERRRLETPLAGCVASGASAFVKTGLYFWLYEYGRRSFASMGTLQLPLAVLLGSSASNVPGTYLTVRKKRRQAMRNGMFTESVCRSLSRRQWVELYCLSLLNKYPKNVVRYVLYESILTLVRHSSAGGALAGFVSSVVVNVLFEPLEATRSYRSLGLEVAPSNPFRGAKIGVLSTTVAGTLGHGLLETVCPR